MNISPEHLDTVCEGCLSLERHLTAEVTDQHIKKLYFEILNITVQNVDAMSLRLCLECKANILKFFAFKKQVEEAHGILHRSLLKSSQSCTAQHRPPVFARPPSLKREDDHDGSLVPDRLTFIKVEDGGDDDTGDGDGEDFVHDGGSRDAEEEKEFTAVLKPDLIAPNALNISSSHTTYYNDNKIYKEDTTYKEEFDASDEEPLYHKKTKRRKDREERDTGERKRRKKENEAPPKRDGRRHPRPRKEKPAGVVDNVRVRDKLRRLNVTDGLIEMRVLSWEEVEAERQQCLSSESFTRHEYRCEHCVLGFNHRVKLTNHMNKHDASAGSFPCSVCAVRCKDQKSLAAHRRRHRVRWRCVLCGATSSRADVAADHLAREHGSVRPTHTCGLCGETAPSLAKLRNHMKNHGERQKCELCGKTFRDRNSLRTHLFIHAGCKEHVCPRCDKRFMFKKALQLHLVTHDEHAHLYCHECDVSFKNVISYNQHMKYSLKHVDPAKLKYVCPVCGKRFMKVSRLEEHNLALHLKLTPVACTQPGCSFACSSRPVLRTHLRMIHRNGRAVRNHVCDACGKTYTTKKTLEAHLRSHTGERPYSCGECGATFCYSAALYNHNKLVHHKPGRSRAKKAPPPPPPPTTVSPPAPPPPISSSAAPPSL